MGGNALSTFTRRYNRDEYFKLYSEISDIFLLLYKEDCYIRLLPSYENKQTFGDMDIIINSDYMTKDVEKIKSIFNPNEVYNNGNVVSFDYKEFQIDFIYMRDKYFNTAYTYYSYNDLGNLMGRIANKFGVKYGHKGLFKKTYTEDRCKILDETFLSCDIRKIFEFLGFNYNTYLQGFKELEDIYNYVVDSEFFNKEIFSYKNLDHQNRTRNKKRKTYQGFLEYIENIKTDDYEFEEDRNLYLEKIDKWFPEAGIYTKINEAKELEKIKLEVKEKFNGKIINELTGLEGEQLGKFIKEFKSQWVDFENYILNSNEDEIEEKIYEKYEILYK